MQTHNHASLSNTQPDGFGAREAQPTDRILIPTYNPNNQFGVTDLERELPQWRQETSYEDPELATISYARTQALREIGRQTGLGNIVTHTGGEGLLWAIQHTPREVGQQFDAHGLANKYDPVTALDDLLQNGIDTDRPFYSMSFIDAPEAGGAIGADHPLTSGGLIVLSEGPRGLQEHGIQYVVVGEEYMRVLALMRSRYPTVVFVPWHEAPGLLSQKSHEAGTTAIDLESPQVDGPIYYPEQNSELGRPSAVAGAAAVAGQVVPDTAPPTEPLPSSDDDVPDVW